MHTQPTPVLLPRRRTALLTFGLGVTAFAGYRPARAQATAAPTAAPALEAPPELSAYAPSWNARGSGTLRFFGFKAYDATLWLPAGQASYAPNRSFALDIRYNTYVKASDIVNTSLIEMSRLASASPEQIKAWTTFMSQLFVDVKSGDRLVGVRVPDKGARFFLNAKLLGESTDEAFTDAFFRIWLDPKTRRPELREALLGTSPAATPAVRSP